MPGSEHSLKSLVFFFWVASKEVEGIDLFWTASPAAVCADFMNCRCSAASSAPGHPDKLIESKTNLEWGLSWQHGVPPPRISSYIFQTTEYL